MTTLAPAPPPAGLAIGGGGRTGDLAARIALAADPRPHRVLAATLYNGAAAVLFLPTVFVAVPWLVGLPLL